VNYRFNWGAPLVATHAEGVLDDEPGNNIVLQEFDEPLVRANADDIDLVVRCLLGNGLAHRMRHNWIRDEYTAQVGYVGDEILHDVDARRRLAVGRPFGNDIFCGDYLLEALGALIEPRTFAP
jgi:hypothetical protein